MKKIKKVSALHHIQSKPNEKAKKKKQNVAELSRSCPLHDKTSDDCKEKPQIIKFYDIKFYDFTKGGTDIVDQLNDYYRVDGLWWLSFTCLTLPGCMESPFGA